MAQVTQENQVGTRKSRSQGALVGRVGEVVNKHLGATQVFGERP
jgi:hypothetical protein